MPTITISQALDDQLQAAAQETGRTPDDLAEELLRAHLEPEPSLLPEQISLLVERVKEIQRGEVVTSEEVDLFFENWFAELKAR